MIKERIIGMLCGICILLLACSEQEENNSVVNDAIMGKEKVDVRLSLSSIPGMEIEGNTDYRPMSTRAEEEKIHAKIANVYKCLVMKEIGGKWYVDTLTQRTLADGSPWKEVEVKESTVWKDLQLTLRPGHYRVLVVLNPNSGKWNPALVPGAVVKGEADTVAHAYTYNYQQSDKYANFGKRQVRYEMFAGSAEFTVKKTSDLHSNPVNGNTHITFFRKVMQMRFLLKNYDSPDFNFSNTQHTVYATLKATEPGKFFCDGLDCWGDAYYNQQQPTTKIEMCTDLDPNWRLSGVNGEEYKISSSHVTVLSPFIYTDSTTTVPYLIDEIKITGQVGYGGYTYYYLSQIPELVLKNNTIQQVVFQTTNEVLGGGDGEALEIALEYLKEESTEKLFDSYYECNIP